MNICVLEMRAASCCTPCKLPFRQCTSSLLLLRRLAPISATCEASFSALSRVPTAYRRSMTHERKRSLRNLVL